MDKGKKQGLKHLLKPTIQVGPVLVCFPQGVEARSGHGVRQRFSGGRATQPNPRKIFLAGKNFADLRGTNQDSTLQLPVGENTAI